MYLLIRLVTCGYLESFVYLFGLFIVVGLLGAVAVCGVFALIVV